MCQVKLDDKKIQLCKERMIADPLYKGKDFKNYSDVPNALMDAYLQIERDELLIRRAVEECSDCAVRKLMPLIQRQKDNTQN